MQKEVLYKYKDSVSDYQQKDQAIYNVEMQNPDIKQIEKLSQGNVSFNIPQLNINYCNSFNENFDITIEYQPIEIYDLNLFITGEEESVRGNQDYPSIQVNTTGDGVFTYTPYKNPSSDQPSSDKVIYDCTRQKKQVKLRFNDQYNGNTITPKRHTFSLQQQSINSLINELNYPLKHIPYGDDDNNPIYHIIKENDGNQYQIRVVGEVDISNQIFWDTYNGKLRFNYNGIIIDPSTWPCLALGSYLDSKDGKQGNNGGYHEVYGENEFGHDYDYNPFGNLGRFPWFKDQINGRIFTYNNGGTFTYNYQAVVIDTYDLLNNILKASETTIYVKQLDSSKENYVFGLNNFYYANQLMGFMQSPQQIFDFLYHYVSGQTPRYSMTFYPQTQYNNYHIKILSLDDTNKYLKNICAQFYLSPVNNADGFDQYINRQVCLSKEFFLQIWREIYVLSPQLQSNTIIYKPENMIYTKQLKYTNTNNANGKDYINQNKNDNQYIFNDKLNCIAYYVNSVSFNNYVSLQNNYPLQYCVDQNFDVESLRNLTFILKDENGVVLPRLSEFKVYIQFQQDQNNNAQNKTTNFNRVLTDN